MIFTDRSERFVLAAMILGMSIVLIIVGSIRKEFMGTVIALIANWIGGITGYFYGVGKNGNNHGVNKS